MTDLYLAHHGVIGQKWGIRRYQNYDGSLTQKGMKRYNASKEAYDKANASYKEASQKYKEGKTTKADVVNKKIARKNAENKLNKDYRHLKQDKLADKGKARYAKGQTITNGNALLSAVSKTAAVAEGAAWLAYNNRMINKKLYSEIAIGTAVTTGAVYAQQFINEQTRNKQLRAYYKHTFNY